MYGINFRLLRPGAGGLGTGGVNVGWVGLGLGRPRQFDVGDSVDPHLAKNERDVGHPGLSCGASKLQIPRLRSG
jgi:hypothetical protein